MRKRLLRPAPPWKSTLFSGVPARFPTTKPLSLSLLLVQTDVPASTRSKTTGPLLLRCPFLPHKPRETETFFSPPTARKKDILFSGAPLASPTTNAPFHPRSTGCMAANNTTNSRPCLLPPLSDPCRARETETFLLFQWHSTLFSVVPGPCTTTKRPLSAVHKHGHTCIKANSASPSRSRPVSYAGAKFTPGDRDLLCPLPATCARVQLTSSSLGCRTRTPPPTSFFPVFFACDWMSEYSPLVAFNCRSCRLQLTPVQRALLRAPGSCGLSAPKTRVF